MKLGPVLIEMRNLKNLSQETLAMELGVSRQTVAKWESGQVVPELDNLLTFCDFMGEKIDTVVRRARGENCGFIGEVDAKAFPRIAVPSSSTEDTMKMIDFLIQAKQAGYAGHGPEVDSSRPSSHDLRHEDGEYLYIDSYLGGEAFIGEEGLWQGENPLWAMNYSGRVLGEDFSGDFLKECLQQVPKEQPFRGPQLYVRNDFVYHCRTEGDFEWFRGDEEIFAHGSLVYECRFHGGVVR